MIHCERASNLLTTVQVAFLLNVHPNTVRQWSNQKVIEAYRTTNQGRRKFRRDEIIRLYFRRAFGSN